MYDHVLLLVVVLQMQMAAKEEGRGGTEVNRQVPLANAKNILSMLPLWIVSKFCFSYYANLSELIDFYSPEIRGDIR